MAGKNSRKPFFFHGARDAKHTEIAPVNESLGE
jgi:hypothetical protein